METTDEYRQERLINVNEIAKIMAVGRTYFSQKIVPWINILEIAPPFAFTVTGHQKRCIKVYWE